MMDAIAMGDYGAYVWTCIGLAVLIVGFNEWLARSRHRKVYRDVEVRIRALEEKQ